MIAVSPEALAAAICLALLLGVWIGEREGHRRAMSQRIFGDTPARLVRLAALKVSKALDDAPRGSAIPVFKMEAGDNDQPGKLATTGETDRLVILTDRQAREWSALLAGQDKGKT
jgi:hypothetical protein